MSQTLPINPSSRFVSLTAGEGQTVFTASFPLQRSGDVRVWRVRGGLFTQLTEFTVSGVGDPGGFSVALATPSLEADVILLSGEAALSRVSSVVRNGRYDSAATDDDLDRLTIIAQELAREVGRSIRLPIDEEGFTLEGFPARGGKIAFFDSLTGALRGAVPGDVAAIIVPIFQTTLEQIVDARMGVYVTRARNWAQAGEDVVVNDSVNPPGNSAFNWAKKAWAAAAIALGFAGDIVAQGNVPIYNTTAGFTQYAVPHGMLQVTLNGYAAVGDFGEAPPAMWRRRGSGETPHATDLVTQGGVRWAYKINGDVWLEHFGGFGDTIVDFTTRVYVSGTECGPAFAAAQSLLAVPGYGSPNFLGGPNIRFGHGIYRMSEGMVLKDRILQIVGSNTGRDGRGYGSTISVAADKCGLTIHQIDTIGDGVQSPVGQSAGTSKVQGVNFISDSNGSGDVTKHGAFIRTLCVLRECTFEGFPGDGLNVRTGNAQPGAGRGNSNGAVFDTLLFKNCGNNGMFSEFSDGNCHIYIACQVRSAKRAGCIHKGLFDGTYFGLRIDNCGTLSEGRCSDGGKNYILVSDTPGIGNSTAPGTNENVWLYLGTTAGGAFTPWTADRTYSIGIGVWCSGASNYAVFFGTYFEAGIVGDLGNSSASWWGGLPRWTQRSACFTNSTNVVGNTVFSATGVGSRRTFDPTTSVFGANSHAAVGPDLANGVLFEQAHMGNGGLAGQIRLRGTGNDDWSFELGNASEPSLIISGPTTGQLLSRITRQARYTICRRFAIGDPASTANDRAIYRKAALPTSGDFAQGENILLINPTPYGPRGYDVTTAGSLAITAWAAGASYPTLGTLRLNDGGKSFILRTPGVSEVGGTGPTGTGTGIVDGTCVWDYRPAPVLSPSMSAFDGHQTIATDANFTLTPNTSPRVTRHTGALTAARTVTLSTTGGVAGQTFTIVRTGTGAFPLNVGTGPLRAIMPGQKARFRLDENLVWYLEFAGDVVPASAPVVLTATQVYDPPSLVAGAVSPTQTVAMAGLAFGDFVEPTFSADTQGLRIDAWCAAAGQASFRFSNPAGGSTTDLASGTVTLKARK